MAGLTKEEHEAAVAKAEAANQKALMDWGVGSEEFLRKHESIMAYCDRVSRMREADLEDKQLICDRLTLALQATRGIQGLMALDYDSELGVVFATFARVGTRAVCAVGDSGITMIRDILSELGV